MTGHRDNIEEFYSIQRETLLQPGFDDQDFAMELLETQHVLVAPGSSFNVDYRNYFRITLLPQAKIIDEVFQRIEKVLDVSRASSGF